MAKLLEAIQLIDSELEEGEYDPSLKKKYSVHLFKSLDLCNATAVEINLIDFRRFFAMARIQLKENYVKIAMRSI